jgi:hypothetical protein
VIVTAHDDGDCHRDVVRHDGEIIDRSLVGAEDDKVLDVLVGERNPVVNHVVPLGGSFGHAEADHVRLTGRYPPFDLGPIEPVASTVIPECFLARFRFAPARVELRRRAEASVRRADFEQSPRVCLMPPYVCALINDVAIPMESEPFESLENRAGAVVGAARLVSVLDAQQELATELARIQPVVERSACSAHVQKPGRRRCES